MLCPSSRWADHPSRFWSHIPSHLWSVRQRMATNGNQWQRVSEFLAPLRRNLHHSALSPAQLKGQLQRNPRYPSQQFVRNPDPKLVKCSPISHRPGATTTGTGACRPFASKGSTCNPLGSPGCCTRHLHPHYQHTLCHRAQHSPCHLPSVAICCMETTTSTRSGKGS